MITRILIRPAARGGKFLGPDAADAQHHSAVVSLIDPMTGHLLARDYAGIAGMDAGPADIMAPVSRAWPYATDAATVGTTLSVDIERPTVIRATVLGPLSHPDQARLAQADVTVLPGVDIGGPDAPQGLVIEIPGLCIGNVDAVVAGPTLRCFAQVTMMCGCPIEAAPDWFWPASAFDVRLVTYMGSGAVHAYPMAFDATPGVKSSFTGQWASVAAPGDTVTEAWVLATQASMGNQGRYRI